MCLLPISCNSCPVRLRCKKGTIFELDLEWLDREKEKWIMSDSSLGGNYEHKN